MQVKATSGAVRTVTLALTNATAAGDLIAVAFDYSGTTFSSISDNQGNAFAQVGSEISTPGGARTRMYVAKDVKGGTESITVTLAATASYLEVYAAEYREPTRPIRWTLRLRPSGSGGTVSSGNATTTTANDVLTAYCVGDNSCRAGSGFTARSTYNSNLVEDRAVGAAGSCGDRYGELGLGNHHGGATAGWRRRAGGGGVRDRRPEPGLGGSRAGRRS